jgi:phosphopantothenoylcysteine decarboxylase/phosphopantothenate--cysteine ligase
MLQGKTVILGVTGGIAAYKSATIVSRLKDLGAEVWVVMTKEAAELVGPLTFRTLSGNPVVVDLFAQEIVNVPVPHVSLADKADLIVIAPCTANIIGKIAQGISDDALTTIVMASKAKKLIAPAMNCNMWTNPIVSENVSKLTELGYEFIGPVEGKLACGEEDIGRMSEPEEIVEKVVGLLGGLQDYKGKHILVTAGGTREAIDPVRYISNRSSGKMGYAIARAARERGASVTLISANVDLPSPLDIKPVKVGSAVEMLEAVLEHHNGADAVIMAAAVADFRPVKNSPNKIKKAESSKQKAVSSIEMEETEDILKLIADKKGRKDRILVGFALETEDLIENAKTKLKEKGLDIIIANDDSTFGNDSAKVAIVHNNGKVEELPELRKSEVADRILDAVLRL